MTSSVQHPVKVSESDTVVVSVERCRKLAELIRSLDVPADREERSLSWMSREETGNLYLLLVAICHQTSPLGKPRVEGTIEGKLLSGWDYLSAKLELAAYVDRKTLSPEFWAGMTASKLREIFFDTALGERLSDPEGRALLVVDLGRKMLTRSWNCADQIYAVASGRIGTGTDNLLELLAQFRAYDDPVRKKSFFFLGLMRNSGIWSYPDPQNLGAPVDYHEVRGHLRIGTVVIRDPELLRMLMSGDKVSREQDISIRNATHKAVMLISAESGLQDPSRLHYLFWNVFRSCCTRKAPHCASCPPDCALPARYVPLSISSDDVRRCAFARVCQSAGIESKLLEHYVETDYF